MAGEERLVAAAVADAVRRAVAQGFDGMGDMLKAFVVGMDFGAEEDLARVHSQIASDVRAAVVKAYSETVEGPRKVPAYERTSRRSGFLGQVIRRNDLARSDAGGVYFINEAALNKEAAHWKRLNFGAGSASGAQPAPVSIRLFGEAVLPAALPYGAQPAFTLPKGFFINGGQAKVPQASYRGAGSRGPFVVSRKSPYRPAVTAGIRGRHFLEAGLEVMADQFSRRYTDLFNEWVANGGERARAMTAAIST